MLTVSLQAFCLNALLAGRTILPAGLRTFVTTNVEILAREKRHHFANNILQEVEHIFLARTHHDILNTPYHSRSPLLALARKIRISRDGCHHVARKVDFWNHGNVALSCISYNVLDFLLCIETAIGRAVTLKAIATDRSQLRIFLDFDTPALVLGQVEVHGIHLEHRHQVELLLYILYSNEVTAWIKMESTITETWSILDVTALSHPLDTIHLGSTLYLRRQQLHETLHTIESTLACLSLDDYTLGSNCETIALFCHLEGWRNLNRDIALLATNSYIVAGRSFQLICHVLSNILTFCGLVRNHHLLWQNKLTLLDLGLDRNRNNIDISCS